jgi:hypothetical protein
MLSPPIKQNGVNKCFVKRIQLSHACDVQLISRRTILDECIVRTHAETVSLHVSNAAKPLSCRKTPQGNIVHRHVGMQIMMIVTRKDVCCVTVFLKGIQHKNIAASNAVISG